MEQRDLFVLVGELADLCQQHVVAGLEAYLAGRKVLPHTDVELCGAKRPAPRVKFAGENILHSFSIRRQAVAFGN